jgi:hypothetical protein
MKRQTVVVALIALAIGVAIGLQLNRAESPVEGRAEPTVETASKGGQEQTGPYEVVENWPKPLSQLQGHEKWTWGAVQGIFAESPNRVFVLMRGELPELERPAEVPYPGVGPSLSFPVSQTPFRNASVGPVSSPGNSGSDGWNGWKGKLGVDARWEHCLFVVDAAGNIVEQWTQWDDIFRRPHSVFINPYDAEKHVWVVDDRQHAVYKFTNDGKQLVQTLGVKGVAGNDSTHFNRPTFLTWLPDSTLYVADGYANTRVVKFDKDGKFLTAWGEKGTPPNVRRSARRRCRSRHAPDIRHRSIERPHSGVRRKRRVPRSVPDRFALYTAGAVHVGRQTSLDCRQRHLEGHQVHDGRSLPVLVGQPRRLAGRPVECARDER